MSNLIVASFSNQFAGSSAVEKLLSCGVKREHIAISTDESVGNSEASSSTPTSILSWIGHFGMRVGQKPFELRSPANQTDPVQFGHMMVAVQVETEATVADIHHLLSASGAVTVEYLEQELPKEDPHMWPEHERGSLIDVRRAIDACRGGELLAAQMEGEPISRRH